MEEERDIDMTRLLWRTFTSNSFGMLPMAALLVVIGPNLIVHYSILVDTVWYTTDWREIDMIRVAVRARDIYKRPFGMLPMAALQWFLVQT
jgi:hypothetical protein